MVSPVSRCQESQSGAGVSRSVVVKHLSRHLLLDTLNSGSVSTAMVSGWILNSKLAIFAKF